MVELQRYGDTEPKTMTVIMNVIKSKAEQCEAWDIVADYITHAAGACSCARLCSYRRRTGRWMPISDFALQLRWVGSVWLG